MAGVSCDDDVVTIWEQLLGVQEVDLAIHQLRHRRSTLPEIAALEANASATVEATAARAVTEEAHRDLVRNQHVLEDEIATVRRRADEHEATYYSGSVTNPRELVALQEDIDSLHRRQRTLEDQDLELMEAIEPLATELEVHDARLAALADERTQLDAALTAAAADIDAELADAESRRAALAADVDPEVLADYDRLRAQQGGIAIARLEGGACGGCHLQLSAVEVDRIRRLDAAERVLCEECGRLLAR